MLPEPLTINEGDQLNLEAAAIGKPIPHIVWKRNLDQIKSGLNENEDPERLEAISQMTKIVTMEDDTSDWFIEASNTVGSVQHQFGLNGRV